MNLRFIETFVLAELRNFRMTAERLHITQAGVQQHRLARAGVRRAPVRPQPA